MAIRPIDEYSGKVATPTADYPDGKAQNITSPGDGTGTPWEAKLVNDIFGFQQYLTSKAGVTPSGTPDNATTSQYFEAIWRLLNVRTLTYNIVSDVDLTLTADQNIYPRLEITDTGVILTAGRNIIVDDIERELIFVNSTAQILTVKTAAGTGVAVPQGAVAILRNDGTNVVESDITKKKFVSVSRNVDLAIAQGSPVKITFNNVIEDDDSLFSLATSLITIDADGKYDARAAVHLTSTAGSQSAYVHFLVNGVCTGASKTGTGYTYSGLTVFTAAAILDLKVGDTVGVYMYTTGTNTINSFTDDDHTWFQLRQI